MEENGKGQPLARQTPAFLEKLFDILDDSSFSSYISWQPDGTSFIIKKVNEFSEKVLPKYFKHSNIQSYIRQLNMYGFSKTRHDSNHREFSHKLFQRDRRDLLQYIKRKTQNQSSSRNAEIPVQDSAENHLDSNDFHSENSDTSYQTSLDTTIKDFGVKERSSEDLVHRIDYLESRLLAVNCNYEQLAMQHNQLCDTLTKFGCGIKHEFNEGSQLSVTDCDRTNKDLVPIKYESYKITLNDAGGECASIGHKRKFSAEATIVRRKSIDLGGLEAITTAANILDQNEKTKGQRLDGKMITKSYSIGPGNL